MTLRNLGTNVAGLNNAFATSLTATAVKTGAYTSAVGDLVPVDASAGAVTITLPAAPADRTRVAVKKIDASTNTVTVARGGASDVFNKAGGSTSLTLSLTNQAVGLQYSGGVWYVVSDDLPLSGLDTRVSSTITTREKAQKLYYLDSYETFFRDPTYIWQTGQGNTATTASGAATAGALTLDVASTTGLSAGVVIITGAGTAQMQQRKIASIAGSTLTLDAALTYPVASGAAVSPLWTDDRHLTFAGWDAFAYWIANAQASGSYVIAGTAPKVTLLGNSWIANGSTRYATAINARIPGATVVNAGVAGNTSAQLLARFDTDVPADSTYVVVNEPGVNDDTNTVPFSTSAGTLEALWRKCRAIGATLIYTGKVPLQPAPTTAATRHTQFDALLGDGSSFPGVTPLGVAGAFPSLDYITVPSLHSLGIGQGALNSSPTGTENIGIGYNAGFALSTGSGNVLIGYAAGAAAVTSTQSVMIGTLAGRFATAGSHVLIGHNAGTSITVGSGSVIVGHEAGHNVAGSTADQSTDKNNQVIIGKQAGGNASDIVCLGYFSKATAQGAMALGRDTVSAFSGAVAIGRDNASTGASTSASNEFVLGTALHLVKVKGRLTVAQRTPTGSADAQGAVGDIAADDSFIYAKGSAGWKRAALATF